MNIIDRFIFWLLRQKHNWERRGKPQLPPPSCNDCKFQSGEWCHHPAGVREVMFAPPYDPLKMDIFHYTTAQMREPWWRCRPEGQWFEPKEGK